MKENYTSQYVSGRGITKDRKRPLVATPWTALKYSNDFQIHLGKIELCYLSTGMTC